MFPIQHEPYAPPDKPYYSTFRELCRRYPRDWARILGIPPHLALTLLDTHLSTLQRRGDAGFGVDLGDAECVEHLEVQAAYGRSRSCCWGDAWRPPRWDDYCEGQVC